MTNYMNPWHHVSPHTTQTDSVQAIIEIPKGSRAKYELDKESGLIKLDRVLFSSVYYPVNYGFIPQSYCNDKDPLDILVLSMIELTPMCIVTAKVIGVMQMVDSGATDNKIIAVAAGDPSVSHYNDIEELPPHFISELRNFFEDYKKLEKKHVEVDEFLNKKAALEIIAESFVYYDTTFRK